MSDERAPGAAGGATVRAVVGTAGHVDHGKTTLVAHWTGIDTDRLTEEKARGISIELGFAWLDLPGGRVALIDVPGHERFVRQMIAGAAGVDVVLLVVAADEGVMPQTREHLDICRLLGVRTGAIVLTKTDLVDDDWLELVEDDVRDAAQGTFLDGAPVWRTTIADPDSFVRLGVALDGLIGAAAAQGALAPRSIDRPFKLSVDRAFTMKGFGAVVTGTTTAGQLAVGDAVRLEPSGLEGRVRKIQVHGTARESVGPGTRAALNLQGIDHHDVARGDVVAAPGALPTASMIDATFRALERLPEPLGPQTRVLLHAGTAQIEATLAVVGQEAIEPGTEVAAQLRLEHPRPFLPGEPYVVRGFAPLQGYGKTLGGGRLLASSTRRHRTSHAETARLVERMASEAPRDAVVARAALVGEAGLAPDRLPLELPGTRTGLAEAFAAALADGALVGSADGAQAWHPDVVARLSAKAAEAAEAFHAAHPAHPAVSADELRTRVRGDLDTALFQAALQRMVDAGELEPMGPAFRRPGFEPRLTADQTRLTSLVLGALAEGGYTPARVQDLPDSLELTASEVREAVDLLVLDGRAARVSKDLTYATEVLDRLKAVVTASIEADGPMDTGRFKELTGASRKWAIPLGEYLDKIRFTVRVGDERRLR